ncbi:ddb1 and cul4 associated factor 7 [Apophysomyces sp. BC1034]|nr:ddb1 and cul4 associated factor 7 [Apophysomyces sp. BC1015]KAG0182939.1 ddb1 and cul4 associated factor 7 [Apophysomyces sp. BC1021]KAG0193746.1 ddb1 and cul4 associated factor 7 [Apophysomyces sp. BC1034]
MVSSRGPQYSYSHNRTSSQEPSHSEKEIYQYEAPWPTYALDWCKAPAERKSFRLAVGSFLEDSNNKVQIISRTDMMEEGSYSGTQQKDFTVVAEADSYYPVTKVLWEPWKGESRNTDLLATTGDILRIWELVDNPRYERTSNSINSSSGRASPAYYMQQLVKKSELVNMKQSDFCAPLTSFDWNETDPSLVVTSSIDTTCTVWNVETNQAKTQLIAHDSDVYDVGFKHGSPDIFASVGADGSVRLFDLRSLEHSTILYEAPPSSPNANRSGQNPNTGTRPLLRLQFSRTNPHLLATFHMDSSAIQILDIRYPAAPVAELVKSHHGSVHCLSWSPTQSGRICTGGDDSQVLVWDINQPASQQQQPSFYQQRQSQQHLRSIQDPILAYTAESEVNALSWSKAAPEWIGVGVGRTVKTLRV